MNQNKLWLISALLAVACIWLVACSSDSPTSPGTGGGDTTAPQVASTQPTGGTAEIAQDAAVQITFSEAMDPATATGNVTLSSGGIDAMSWSDDRTLEITHAIWAEGTHVTVTLGTGLSDAAGNGLAAAYSFSFYVFSSTLSVLETTPADAATGVDRATNVQLLFSQSMDRTSVATNTTVTSNGGLTDHPFTVPDNNSTVTLMITSSLPASTLITVTVGAATAAAGGATLGTEYVFSFTTGATVDTTPPTVVSVSPANGSTAAVNVGLLQITFSEPMDPMTFDPTAWNVEFATLITATDPTPTWSSDNTVVTVPLPSPLPAGLPISVTFGGLTDAHGIVQSTPWNWHVTVAGTPDYYPSANGTQMMFNVKETGGTIGNGVPTWTNLTNEFLQIDAQPNDILHLADYDIEFLAPLGSYDIYRRLADRFDWLGFRDMNGTVLDPEMIFDSPMEILPLPLSAGNWTSGTTVTIPGEGTFTAALSGTVTGPMDLPLPESGGALFYKDAYRVITTLQVMLGNALNSTETDTTWYSPTLGPVQANENEEDQASGEWQRDERWRVLNVFK